ncbi:MAG: hypothetical protein VKP72_08820 [bacterium]|nr:hypothetical protein [bacterium]
MLPVFPPAWNRLVGGVKRVASAGAAREEAVVAGATLTRDVWRPGIGRGALREGAAPDPVVAALRAAAPPPGQLRTFTEVSPAFLESALPREATASWLAAIGQDAAGLRTRSFIAPHSAVLQLEDAAGRTLVRQQLGQNLEARALDLSTTIVNPYAVASGPLFPGQTGPGAGPEVARQLFDRLQALARGLGFEAVTNTPAHYHNAVAYRRLGFEFVRPEARETFPMIQQGLEQLGIRGLREQAVFLDARGLQGLPNGAAIAAVWERAGLVSDPRHPMLLYTQRLPVT